MRHPAEQVQQRHEIIVRMLGKARSVSSVDLARRFGVNVMTIRRDLKELERQGQVICCYGGAVPAKRIEFEIAFDEARQTSREHKRRIGELAATRIAPGQRVFLDTGTTTLEVARSLKGRALNCHVITSSLVIAAEMWAQAGVRLTLLGGDVRPGSPDMAGPVTEWVLEKLSADVAILGADGVDPQRGFFAGSMEVARIAERMVASAGQSIVVADATKLNRAGGARYAALNQIAMLITDKRIESPDVHRFQKYLEVKIA